MLSRELSNKVSNKTSNKYLITALRHGGNGAVLLGVALTDEVEQLV
jgi:hypothetical protein